MSYEPWHIEPIGARHGGGPSAALSGALKTRYADDDNAPLWPRHGESWDEFTYRQLQHFHVKVPKPGGLYPKGGEHEYAAIGAPPQRGQHESRSHVYLDGRVVGELIERHITRRHAHTSGPGGHDGRRGLTPVDSWSVA